MPSFYSKTLLNIEALCQTLPLKQLKDSQQRLSLNYRQHNPTLLLTDYASIISYAAARMPATYKAVQQCYQSLPTNFVPGSILDLGAGPGTASLAALDQWSTLKNLTLVENHPLMQQLAQILWNSLDSPVKYSYIHAPIETLSSLPLKEYDLVVLSYVLGELSSSQREAAVLQAWQKTKQYCLIVTPGTQYDFKYLMQVRDLLLEKGALLLAPCPHQKVCPMALTSHWCHFSARLQRRLIHQRLKTASLGYEDEKYSYLIVSKPSLSVPEVQSRLIHKPIRRPGHLILDSCTQEGKIDRQIISKKHPLYKDALQKDWGDTWVKKD